MPAFPRDDLYQNVNEIADREGLIWDGYYGSPYDVNELIPKELRDDRLSSDHGRFGALFDHTKRFKPRGSGARKPVLAISSPYTFDEDDLRPLAAEFAERFGLEYRFNDPQDRVYVAEGTIPITFWRADLHDFVG